MKYLLYILPFLTFGQYLQPNVNSHGNIVTQISDNWDVSDQQLQHNYSTDQCFNIDGSLLKLAGYPAAILDGNTYEFLYWSNIPSYARWSNTVNYLMYGTSVNKFVEHNVLTNQRTVLHDFGHNIDFGYGESNQDLNDRYVGLLGDGKMIIYDIYNDTFLTHPHSTGLDWFSVSSYGNYAVASYFNDGLFVYDNQFNLLHSYPYTEHNTFAIVNGQEVLIMIGNESTWSNGYYLTMLDLATGQETQFYTDELWCGHISSSVENWITVSESCVDFVIFNYNVLTGEKITMHYANVGGRASVSRNTDKIVFSEYYAYVVESEATLNTEGVVFNTEGNDIITEGLIVCDMSGRILGENLNKEQFKYLWNRLERGVYIVEYRYLNIVKRKKVIK